MVDAGRVIEDVLFGVFALIQLTLTLSQMLFTPVPTIRSKRIFPIAGFICAILTT